MLLLPRQQFQSAGVESWVVKSVALRHLQASSSQPADPGGEREADAQAACQTHDAESLL